MTGIIPVILAPFITREDRLARRIYLVGIFCVLGVSLFGNPNPHYFTSVALLFLVPFLRVTSSLGPKKALYLMWVHGLIIGILLLIIFPFGYAVNQDARTVGSQTCIDALDYQEQVKLAKSIYAIFPFNKYGIGHHTLVFYSSKGNCFQDDYSYIFTEREVPSKELGSFTRMNGLDLLVRRGFEIPAPPASLVNS